MEGEKKHCFKCLLREMDKDAYMENLYDYIQRLDQDLKADQALYEERLSVCKACDYLEDGMCRACGCFVELRAVMRKNVVPMEMVIKVGSMRFLHIHPIWCRLLKTDTHAKEACKANEKKA